MLRAVDISSSQKGIDPAALDCDIVIVKVTGGDYYTNGYPSEAEDYWRIWADSALASGKLLGLYHYARDKRGGYATPETEARRFLDAIAPYIGRCVVALDWEHEADAYPISWAREWMGIVARETGATPVLYAGAADINHRDFSCVAQYPLWMSSYLFRYYGSGWVEDPLNTWALGAWDRMAMYQYTGTGRIDGWDDDLDLSIFYGDRNDWDALIGGGGMTVDTSRIEAMVQHAIDIANDDSHGYSWADRWNTDRDCSSLMYDSADAAGYPVGRGVDKTRYTGTMIDDFTAAGFAKLPYAGTELRRGDILLRDPWGSGGHTEMYIGDGMNVGAHSAEDGGVYGQPGDQTGNEISVTPNYGNWEWVLRPPVEYKIGDWDMAECVFWIKDDHCGFGKDSGVYWNATTGFAPLPHYDDYVLLKKCNPKLVDVDSSKKAPWVVRAYECLATEEAKATFPEHKKK